MAIKKAPARKPNFVQRMQAQYQRAFDERNDPDKRKDPKPKPAAPRGRQFGEPAEFTPAQKAKLRELRASSKKGGKR